MQVLHTEHNEDVIWHIMEATEVQEKVVEEERSAAQRRLEAAVEEVRMQEVDKARTFVATAYEKEQAAQEQLMIAQQNLLAVQQTRGERGAGDRLQNEYQRLKREYRDQANKSIAAVTERLEQEKATALATAAVQLAAVKDQLAAVRVTAPSRTNAAVLKHRSATERPEVGPGSAERAHRDQRQRVEDGGNARQSLSFEIPDSQPVASQPDASQEHIYAPNSQYALSDCRGCLVIWKKGGRACYQHFENGHPSSDAEAAKAKWLAEQAPPQHEMVYAPNSQVCTHTSTLIPLHTSDLLSLLLSHSGVP